MPDKTTPNGPPGAGKRRKGRPGKQGDGVGRERLITATRELLREMAPGKLTRNQIAERANADPALIRYYFRDTSGLLTAVVQSIHRENLRRFRAAMRAPGPPMEKLGQRVKLILQMHVENPYYHQLIFEQLWHGHREDQARIGRDMVDPYYREFRRLIVEGQRTGDFRDVDPRLVHVATLSLCELFINAPYMLERLYRVAEVDHALIDRYGNFVVEMLTRGIGRSARESPAPRTCAG